VNEFTGAPNSCQTAATFCTKLCWGEDGTNVGSLTTKESNRLSKGESHVGYAPQGYLLFMREGSLLAQPFDPKRLEITGDPIPLPEPVQYKKGLLRSSLSISENGVLAYESGNLKSQLISVVLNWTAELKR
jgi:hypothetical protein